MLDSRLGDWAGFLECCSCWGRSSMLSISGRTIVQWWKSLGERSCLLPQSGLIVISRRRPSKFTPDWDRRGLNNDFTVSASVRVLNELGFRFTTLNFSLTILFCLAFLFSNHGYTIVSWFRRCVRRWELRFVGYGAESYHVCLDDRIVISLIEWFLF